MVTRASGPKMWSEKMFVYAEGSYNGYGKYTGTEWNLKNPKTDTTLSQALSNPESLNKPTYSGNFVFGMDFTHGRCLSYEPSLDLGFRAKLGTDAAVEALGTLKTTQNVVRPGFAISSETSVRAQAGINFIEAAKLNEDTPLRYEADIKAGPLFRWGNGNGKVKNIVELAPYAGFGIEGATGNEQLKGKVLYGTKLRIRFPHDKYTGMYGGHIGIDVNNKEARIQAGIGL